MKEYTNREFILFVVCAIKDVQEKLQFLDSSGLLLLGTSNTQQWGMWQPGMPGCCLAMGLFCEQDKHRHLCLLLHQSDQLKNHTGIREKSETFHLIPAQEADKTQSTPYEIIWMIAGCHFAFHTGSSQGSFTNKISVCDTCTLLLQENMYVNAVPTKQQSTVQPDTQKWQ